MQSSLKERRTISHQHANNLLPYQEKDRLHLPVDENYFKIVIQDNDIRFEKEYADRIFQIFKRLHRKPEYPGSGIGPAICKKIRGRHKGITDEESTPELAQPTFIYLKDKFQRKHELS